MNEEEKIQKLKDERIGMKFGRYTIIDFHGKRDDVKNNEFYWMVKCNCGNERLVLFRDLKNKITKSCGCSRRTEIIFVEENNYFLVKCVNGEFLIDTDDYDKVKSIDSNIWIDNKGYVVYEINKKRFSLHRFIMNMDKFDGTHIIDHINRNRVDNRKANLRIVTHIENAQNCDVFINNTSGVKGVSWHKRDSKWQASICVNRKSIYLGCFDKFEDAIKARKDAENKYFKI